MFHECLKYTFPPNVHSYCTLCLRLLYFNALVELTDNSKTTNFTSATVLCRLAAI